MAKPRILCVDDEPNVLEGLKLHLRRGYDVTLAPSGRQALQIISDAGAAGAFAIILSDMRMPEMDGAAFLRQARQVTPDSVRMLLTGHSEMDAAISAINEGQIFRFLTKPCPPQTLLDACAAAAEQHRLITAERVLLEQTLHGSMKALTDILALAKPMAFGRAVRIRQHVSAMAVQLQVRDVWQIEVAALLSQVGCVTLRAETVEKLYKGQQLSPDEQDLVDRLPQVAEQLIAHIPRLEGICEILSGQGQRFDGGNSARKGEAIPLGARILTIAHDYDVLETQGMKTGPALDTLRSRHGRYDPALLEVFCALLGKAHKEDEIREVRLKDLRVGMIFAEDVRTQTGTLLLARGYDVTPGVLEKVANFPPGLVREPVRVVVRGLV